MSLLHSHIMYILFMFLERNVRDVTYNGNQHNWRLPHLAQCVCCVCIVWDYTYNDLHGNRNGVVEGRVAPIFGHHS